MRRLAFFAPIAATIGFLAIAVVFVFAIISFKRELVSWAEHDLSARAELAALALVEPLATQDFRAIRAFGDRCIQNGLVLTISAAGGGRIFASQKLNPNERVYAVTHPCGENRVTLALSAAQVLAPFYRALFVFGLAFLTGVAGMVFVFFAMYRQHARLREMLRVEAFRVAFVADVSHEIKTPLAGILGCVDLLSANDASMSSAMRSKLFAGLKDASFRLNALAQDIVSLSRIDAAAREGQCVQDVFDLAELAREVVARFTMEASAKKINLVCKAEKPRPTRGDVELIGRALSNLVRNAILHSGSLCITVAVTSSGVVVEDQGIGIPPEHRERIFDRFYRIDPSRSDQTGGSGLGLAIARGIARLHGGEMFYEPVSPQGSRFVLRLPLGTEIGLDGDGAVDVSNGV